MSSDSLTVGLPAGSLADPQRGGSLTNLLHNAGFPSKGYDRGGPSAFPVTPFLIGWDGRPQEFGAQLSIGEIDLAIGGDDWVRERSLEFKYEYNSDIQLQKVLPLQRGSVRIVIIGRPDATGGTPDCDEWLMGLLKEKKLVTMVAEMPYLALDWFKQRASALGLGDSHAQFSVQKFKTPPKIDSGIVIYESWGKTEAKVLYESVDFGMEITQTGSALRNYGLVILADVMQSDAGVWARPDLKDDAAKYDLAKMFLLNLYGAIHAENKVLVFFNAKKDAQDKFLRYLSDQHLFGDEPTVNEGVNFIEFSIQLDAGSKALPLAKVRYELAKLGATAIETIPLESSIPGLDVIEF
jgi:ATP phosphoribosyltransferase